MISPGPHFGLVTDNLDPEKLGRVRAKVETAGFIDQDTPWARPLVHLIGGAPDMGLAVVPPVGSLVLIYFAMGDPDRPLWLGSIPYLDANVSTLPKLARGEGDETTQSPKGTDSFAVGGSGYNEPASPFDADYPHNYVFKTPNGVVIEVDDTPNKQRIQLWHPAGAYLEFHPDGQIVMRVGGRSYRVVEGDDDQHVQGNLHAAIDGNADVKVGGSALVEGNDIKMGDVSAVALMKNTIIALFNAHIHPDPVSGFTGAPTTPYTVADATTKLKGS